MWNQLIPLNTFSLSFYTISLIFIQIKSLLEWRERDSTLVDVGYNLWFVFAFRGDNIVMIFDWYLHILNLCNKTTLMLISDSINNTNPNIIFIYSVFSHSTVCCSFPITRLINWNNVNPGYSIKLTFSDRYNGSNTLFFSVYSNKQTIFSIFLWILHARKAIYWEIYRFLNKLIIYQWKTFDK